MPSDLTITNRKPDEPDTADFAIYIDFVRGEGSPYRVFRAADEIIKALERLDRALCASVDPSIEPLMVLEEIEAGSLKIWLRDRLHAIDDQALKDLDWKPAIGKYLVRAKYAFIRWTNNPDGEGSLKELGSELRKIAEETDVRHIPDYSPPSSQELVAVTKQIDSAKGNLVTGDKLRYISTENDPLDFDLSVRWDIEKLENFTIKEVTKFENMSMNLIVKKPDYLGSSKWEFRHGSKPILAKIADEKWLIDFHRRRFDIRPGDALKCSVTVEYYYGFDNELVKEQYTIDKVSQILVEEFGGRQGRLIDYSGGDGE